MSRVILNDHPWSNEEVQYFMDRGREYDIRMNRADFPPGQVVPEVDTSEVTLELHPDVFNHVKDLTVAQLQSELKRAGLKPTGDETEMKVVLAQHLQGKRDAANG